MPKFWSYENRSSWLFIDPFRKGQMFRDPLVAFSKMVVAHLSSLAWTVHVWTVPVRIEKLLVTHNKLHRLFIRGVERKVYYAYK